MAEDKDKVVCDPDSHKTYQAHHEKRFDIATAIISISYLLVMLAFFFWQLFEVWIGRFTLGDWLGYSPSSLFASPTFKIVAYTFIGGGLGGIVNGIRSVLFWHCEEEAFGRRFIWKYISSPWVGTTLALFVYALVRSGVAVLGGGGGTEATGTRQVLAMFAIGVLAGYGSHDVFSWLDAQVTRIFKPETGKVPNLIGKTEKEAEDALRALDLKLGKVTREVSTDDSKVGKIINQKPAADSTIGPGGKINVTIATKKDG
jgi:hypothetical protein